MEQKPQEKITESFKGEELIEESPKTTKKVEEAKTPEVKAKKEVKAEVKKETKAEPKKEQAKPKVSSPKKTDSLFDKMSTWQAVAGILAALLLLSVFTSGFSVSNNVESISLNEAEALAINYVNSNLLQAPFTAELESSEDEGDLYRLTITVAGQTVDSYMTKDGQMFFPQGFDTAELVDTVESEPIQLNTQGQPMLGDENAPVTIIEFSDFECPFCKRGYDTMKQVIAEYVDTGKANVVFMDFPLSFHQNAKPAAIAAACAGEQDMFWEFHDLLFENQASLNTETYIAHAEALSLDVDMFTVCIEEERYAADVDADMAMGQQAGVTGTPAFIINGELISGAVPFSTLASTIDSYLTTEPAEVEFAVEGEEVALELAAKKWLFTPKTLSVNEGDTVTLTIQPEGLDFEFSIPELGVAETVSGETTVTFTADTKGTYEYVCSSCEGWRGMSGTLTVQ